MCLIRLQKQIRELRADITDAERKESDECKKRETAVSKFKLKSFVHLYIMKWNNILYRKWSLNRKVLSFTFG